MHKIGEPFSIGQDRAHVRPFLFLFRLQPHPKSTHQSQASLIFFHLVQHLFQPFVVNLYPFSLQKGQAFRLRKQRLNLFPGKRHPVHSKLRTHGENGIHAQKYRLLFSQIYRHGYATLTLFPPVRNPADNPGFLNKRNGFQYLPCFLRGQTQRVKQLPALHKLSDQRRYFCHFIQTGQQFQKLFAVLPVFRKSILQRHMAHFSILAFCGIGSQKCKGIVILAVLHKMKKDSFRNT